MISGVVAHFERPLFESSSKLVQPRLNPSAHLETFVSEDTASHILFGCEFPLVLECFLHSIQPTQCLIL